LKELGVSSEPSLAASERAGSSVADASLNTRDALDKYQIIAQKVALNPFAFACVSFATSILLILMSEQGDN
jgi:hypothetical protein